jgi:polysaccharide export outer membrane protein
MTAAEHELKNGALFVKLPIWIIALLAGLFAAGAYAAEPVAKKTEAPAQAQPVPKPSADAEYLLSPEDVLEISVWKEESLTKQVVVRPDGAFSFPLVGDVQATAKTVETIREEIKERLKKYIPEPVVSVSLLKVTGYKIYVIGRVNKPGEFVTGRFVDVLQALAMAGGLTPFAAENDIRILRRVDGNEYVRNFRYADVRKGQHLEQNILLRSGDTVVVP